jgi:hypothetical protein
MKSTDILYSMGGEGQRCLIESLISICITIYQKEPLQVIYGNLKGGIGSHGYTFKK